MTQQNGNLGSKLELSFVLAALLILLAIVAFPLGRELDAAIAVRPEITEYPPPTVVLVHLCRCIRIGGWLLLPVFAGIAWSAWRGRLNRLMAPLTMAGILGLLALSLLAGWGAAIPFSHPAILMDES